MSFIQAAGLAVRLFAVWLFLFTFQIAAAAMALQRTGNFPGTAIYLFAPTAITIALGFFLWRFPLAIARILVPRTSDQATSITLTECWKLASVSIGLLVFAQAGPLLLRDFALMLYASRSGFDSMPLPERTAFVEALAKVVIALLLVFKNGAIYRWFGTPIREAPVNPTEQAE